MRNLKAIMDKELSTVSRSLRNYIKKFIDIMKCSTEGKNKNPIKNCLQQNVC